MNAVLYCRILNYFIHLGVLCCIWQEGSDSDDDSNDELQTSNKPPKRARGKLHANVSKGSATSYPDLLQYQSTTSNYGCLSLLKKKRSGGILQWIKLAYSLLPIFFICTFIVLCQSNLQST